MGVEFEWLLDDNQEGLRQMCPTRELTAVGWIGLQWQYYMKNTIKPRCTHFPAGDQ